METNDYQFESLIQTMKDSVILLNQERKILFCNLAAKKLLASDADLEFNTLPNELIEIAERIFFGDLQADAEIFFEIKGVGSYLQVHGQLIETAIDRSDNPAGNGTRNVLLVLNDVSRLHKLENIRKEFVANVSHELKTPITSIKAAVETLQDGAVNDPEVMPKFLDMIARQSERLNTIIEDLLSLSRLENEGTEIDLIEGSILEVLGQAVSNCDLKARNKNIEIQVQASSGLRARMNPTLLEQALVNLVVNSIKYSENGKIVIVRAVRAGKEIEISVQDFGYGISPEHLPRIFERFYRVDKARSRNAGGSGLGLSIVKHIAQIHGGRALVESTLGEGSKFSVMIPTA
jgi:two-component system phosphate regulon sensor histidine kinase PhoR